MKVRESQTRTQSNVISVREVTRDITQHRDGTIKTLETETIKEQAFILQEEIQKELSVAKEMLMTRRMNEWHELTTAWRHPPLARRKVIDDRRTSVLSLARDGDIAVMRASIETSLAEQRAQIRESCATFDLALLKNPAHRQQLRSYQKPAVGGAMNGSHYFAAAVFRLQLHAQYQKEQDAVMARLEQHRTVEKPVAVNGVFRRTKASVTPFTLSDNQVGDLVHQAEKIVGPMEEYVMDCLLDRPAAVTPALAHLISAAILSRAQIQWPALLCIDSVEECSLHRFPLTPLLFWGKSQTEKEWFANCTFQVGEMVYENVWLELPLLAMSQAYGEAAVRHFQDSKQREEQRSIGYIRDVADLLQQVPQRHEEFNKLRRMQSDLIGAVELKEELAEVLQQKKELAVAVHRLQSKSRRI